MNRAFAIGSVSGFVLPAALALAFLLPVACSGGEPPADTAAEAKKVAVTDPSNWPADDKSMCDWKNKPELEVSETAGPGALKPNVRRVFKTFGDGESRHKSLVCREIDTNLDGIKDVVRTFNAKGEAVHEEADTNYDGKIDSWISFVGGRISEEDLDTNGDGKIDVWKYYLDGVLSRVKRDTNFDGKPDVWEIYNNGHLERMGVDTQHTGHVDRWDRDQEVQRRAEEEEIKAREKAQEAHSAGADGGASVAASSMGDAGASAASDAGAKPKKKK